MELFLWVFNVSFFHLHAFDIIAIFISFLLIEYAFLCI